MRILPMILLNIALMALNLPFALKEGNIINWIAIGFIFGMTISLIMMEVIL